MRVSTNSCAEPLKLTHESIRTAYREQAGLQCRRKPSGIRPAFAAEAMNFYSPLWIEESNRIPAESHFTQYSVFSTRITDASNRYRC